MALVAVLVVTAIVVTLASTFIASTGTTTTISRNIESHTQARRVAESGIRLTLAYIRATSNWRTQKSEGTWVTNAALSGGTFSITVIDGADTNGDGVIANPAEGDGSLSDDSADRFTITATATFSTATYTSSAVATPDGATTKVLFVVPDKLSLTTQDDAKQTLMLSWNFEVQLISASESQSAFDTATGGVTVAYISEEVISSQVGTKLFISTIGVVNEEQVLTDEYGFSASNGCYTSTNIDIVDNSHEITNGLTNGSLAILSSSSDLHTATGTLGGGANVLARRPSSSDAVLIAIEIGGSLYGGGTAAGRRVHLPWGCNAYDIATLNDTGKNLMKRSIEWASAVSEIGVYTVRWQEQP